MKRRPVDTKTRFQGVYARHSINCDLAVDGPECTCKPSYWGVAWDKEERRPRKTEFCRLAREAGEKRRELQEALRQGTAPRTSGINLGQAITRFIKDARDGVALNKRRRRYRPRAVDSLDETLGLVPDWLRHRGVGKIKRGDVQRLADDLSAEGKSGSRVRAVVNSLRAMYRWAQEREYSGHDPAQLVRLPAPERKPRDRVATPAEFAELLSALGRQTPEERREETQRSPRDALRDSVPYALAGYGTARKQEIEILDWTHIDFELDAMELAADEEGRKPGGSWRIVPMVKPLSAILRQEWLAQGRPKRGRVCPPKRKSHSGRIALNTLQRQVKERWRAFKLKPITLHEARHTSATWLDHAGVSPKVASEIMGHTTPEQRGAAPITLRVYTHVLPGELERAREQLDAFLLDRVREAGARSWLSSGQ